MNVTDKILQLFEKQSEWTVKELVIHTDATKQMIHLVLNRLMEKGFIEKFGRTPKTFYRKKKDKPSPEILPDLSPEQNEWLAEQFLLISETGNMLSGLAGFVAWCLQRKLPVEKTFYEFFETKKKYDVYYNSMGIVDGMDKLKNTKGFEKISLDKLYYLDFYAIERFGKTRLGTLIHYAKQGQNKYLMKIIVQEIKDKIDRLLKNSKAEAVCFVPPTIRREVQIMKYLQQHLNIPLPVLNVKKISGLIPVPQKSLPKLEERIVNAQSSFAIMETRKFNHIVLIDDAVGSGATMNEIATKLKERRIAKKVTGIAITGSFKGFDVITDV
jgi:hypothetical protein